MERSGRKRRPRGARPSPQTLAKVEAIKKSSQEWLEAARADSSSSSGEDENEEVMTRTLGRYLQQFGGDKDGGGKELVPVSLLSAGPGSCLVCLSSIRRVEAVWSCVQCYCIYHLVCVQQWVKDSATTVGALSPELFPGCPITWSCPKCRREYPQSACPKDYRCYCGKLVDPPPDPWLLPHSCGELCGRPLQPDCGHHCLSLCHPGACPPCPKTASVACYCRRTAPRVRRCGAGGWSCNRICRKELSCGLHLCEERCHGDLCPPCGEVSEVSCECGRESCQRACAEGRWGCGQICGRPLTCGHHNCQQVCHSGECAPCPDAGVRTCPCGKTKHQLPCTQEVPLCGDTCGLALACGRHDCVRQCHRGSCGTCRQLANKRCRCGRKDKELVCSLEFFCETRCLNLRQCGRHQCRRKCCDGSCPPCEQRCSKTLACRNHKCAAPCHTGPCYPCVLMVKVTCKCGAAVISVPCGTERTAKPPRCRKPCHAPPACNHAKRKAHSCHFGPCPPCRLVCGAELPCGHACQTSCHSEPQLVRPVQPSLGIISSSAASQPAVVVKPCPPCSQLVEQACRGGHEVARIRCSEVREFSCGRKCGRSLECGNHTCQRECHVISGGDECQQCERSCERGRSCPHPCPLPCHAQPCPECEVLCRMQCHCGTMTLFVKCREWRSADVERKVQLQTCNSQCVRQLECGHRCPRSCHPGPCPPPEDCRRKTTVRCPCKRIKKEFRCSVRESVACDGECVRLERERREEEERVKEVLQLAAEKEQEQRLEALERQHRPRRRRPRNKTPVDTENESTFLQRNKLAVIIVAGLSLLVCACAMLSYAL